jgi:hypothetical protein
MQRCCTANDALFFCEWLIISLLRIGTIIARIESEPAAFEAIQMKGGMKK